MIRMSYGRAAALLRNTLVSLIATAYRHGLLMDFAIPEMIRRRLRAREVFRNKAIRQDPRGFWCIHPMPSSEELGSYYRDTYWQVLGKEEGVSQRDIDHFLLLRDAIPEFFSTQRTILNFGAGHGGISHLFYLLGHNVVNIEPSGLSLNYACTRWKTYTRITDSTELVDLIYGSHSLEHVQDIDDFEKIVWGRIKADGYVFWEVPNGRLPANGGCDGTMVLPHTYYLTTSYFNTLKYAPLLNATFREGQFPSTRGDDESGEVIRFLGRKEAH